LKRNKVLVVGLGEVGLALFGLLRDCGKFDVYAVDTDKNKAHLIDREVPREVNIMHVCIPCVEEEKFTDAVVDCVTRFNPQLVIVNSTVPPGTTMHVYSRCRCLVAHSPVRGVHKTPEYMRREIMRWTKYVGGANARSGRAACLHFEKAGLKTQLLRTCTDTELAKLFETTYRAWMIVCFQEMHRISRHFKANFDEIVDFLEDTHRTRLDRPIMFPDVIGGHCLIPNIRLLLKAYNSDLLRLALKSNKKRTIEVKVRAIKNETDKIRRRAAVVEKDLTDGDLTRRNLATRSKNQPTAFISPKQS